MDNDKGSLGDVSTGVGGLVATNGEAAATTTVKGRRVKDHRYTQQVSHVGGSVSLWLMFMVTLMWYVSKLQINFSLFAMRTNLIPSFSLLVLGKVYLDHSVREVFRLAKSIAFLTNTPNFHTTSGWGGAAVLILFLVFVDKSSCLIL